ncbi:helix-turn-helix domain-containing protein [Arthrobacter sp. ok362]|uniref:helix-turn-helix domain-containing protein n=1 Tax=Arthrobacter sp. ok362 TaxID=1761745 RepID=UPI0008897EC5|nr:helix-turn-helix domain-containing protein [Arthrobacter sp. ok362]SDL54082.1 Helix-turn-helix domain-containing protein [Arthrobacter sp. ok362]
MTASEGTTHGIQWMPKELMTRGEVASYLRRSPGTLANWAAQRKGPPYYRQVDGTVVYAIEDLAEWLTSQRVAPRAA